jgi:putative transcriptional regulator
VSVRHHPADAVLADYAGGTLRPGFDIVVAAHLESCERCRRHVRLFEKAAGAMLDALAPAEMSADALPHLLARLEREPSVAPADTPDAPRDTRPLLDRLPLRKRRWLAPGVWVQPVDVPQLAGDKIYLLRVGAGLRGLHHGHSGPEFTAVVSGALRDGQTTYRAGDFIECDTDVVHRPKVLDDDGGCLCLAATEGSLKARGMLGELIRAFAGV